MLGLAGCATGEKADARLGFGFDLASVARPAIASLALVRRPRLPQFLAPAASRTAGEGPVAHRTPAGRAA